MIGAALVLMLSAPATGAVRVEMPPARAGESESGRALRGAVARRLLEDGYALVGPDSKRATEVFLRPLQAGVLIVVRSGSSERAEEVPAARDDLLRLEVAHRVLMLLEDEALQTTSSQTLPTAAVGFRGRAPSDAEIQQATAPLVASGFAVVAEDMPSDWAVCVRWEGDEYSVQRGASPPCEGDPLAPATVGPTLDAVVAVEVARLEYDRDAKLEADLGALADSVATADSESESPPLLRSSRPKLIEIPSLNEAEHPTKLAPWGVIRAQGGLEARSLPFEGLYTVEGAGGRGRWGGALRVGFSPTSGSSLRVLDTFISAGPTFRAPVSRRVHLSAALLGGVLVHRYEDLGVELGHRVDAQATAPFSVSLHLGRGVGLLATALLGLSSRARNHRRGDAIIWSRSRFRGGLTLGLEVAFGPNKKREAP